MSFVVLVLMFSQALIAVLKNHKYSSAIKALMHIIPVKSILPIMSTCLVHVMPTRVAKS